MTPIASANVVPLAVWVTNDYHSTRGHIRHAACPPFFAPSGLAIDEDVYYITLLYT
jgi:hypothetical protein